MALLSDSFADYYKVPPQVDSILHSELQPSARSLNNTESSRDSGSIMGARRQILADHLLVVLFISILQIRPAHARHSLLNTFRLPNTVGVWNRSLYPASQFRDNIVVGYFDVWPENATSKVNFTYFCEDPEKGNLSLSNFTYGTTKGRLNPRPYYDLGIVESYQPYWHHWTLWQVDTTRLSYPINCEYKDLHNLYAYRFWKMTMPEGCRAAAKVQCIIQAVVLGVVILRWGWKLLFIERMEFLSEKEDQHSLINKEKHAERKKLIWTLLKHWFWNLSYWWHWFAEAIHLGLLVLLGFGLMEAIGHSDVRTWRPMMMYNTAVIYTWLSLFAVAASILRQIAYIWMEPRKVVEMARRSRKSNEVDPEKKFTMECEVWYALENITDDWWWQRVFGQLGVLVLLGTFLEFVDDTFPGGSGGMDQMAGLMLAATVVACIWSLGVTAVISFRSIQHIVAQVIKVDEVSDTISSNIPFPSRRHGSKLRRVETKRDTPVKNGPSFLAGVHKRSRFLGNAATCVLTCGGCCKGICCDIEAQRNPLPASQETPAPHSQDPPAANSQVHVHFPDTVQN